MSGPRSRSQYFLFWVEDIIGLDLISINKKLAKEEQIRKITQFFKERDLPTGSIVSGGKTQDRIDETMARIKKKHSRLFSGLGKVVNADPVHIEIDTTVPPVQQKRRVIQIHYKRWFKEHIK